MTVRIGELALGGASPLLLIAGPCVIESEDMTLRIATELRGITARLKIPWVFKASYDKANRTSAESYRGPGLEKGLAILGRVRREVGVPVISDVHEVAQVAPAARVLDAIQIPAFLCRQTDLLVAAGRTMKPINIKKGQFMAPEDMAQPIRKVRSTGNDNIFITERGASFGYHNLVVDMRSLAITRETGRPVVFDATHSVQLPAADGSCSGGERKFVPLLARAAVAAGVDGLFMEVHPDPNHALCDGPNSWPLDGLEELLRLLKELDRMVKSS
ncbi:MAG TPA: 3-deoxy-8-phosphooctulonate synthase [bacterium]|nr:3-deoxy-8-phosphooctulonate synthase [bacterium]